MILITADDIEAALGVGFASDADRAWADLCAAAATTYVNNLPIAADPGKQAQVSLAGIMLAEDSYHRRPSGQIAPDFSGETLIGQASPSLVPIVNRMLELGQHEQPWIA
jgi:hypothetical protein